MNKRIDYKDALQDDESLAIFLRAMAKFDHFFCSAMAQREDFTLKMEVHGNHGQLIHARVQMDGFERPPGVKMVRKRSRER